MIWQNLKIIFKILTLELKHIQVSDGIMFKDMFLPYKCLSCAALVKTFVIFRQ